MFCGSGSVRILNLWPDPELDTDSAPDQKRLPYNAKDYYVTVRIFIKCLRSQFIYLFVLNAEIYRKIFKSELLYNL
jgi:hypothetical protein